MPGEICSMGMDMKRWTGGVGGMYSCIYRELCVMDVAFCTQLCAQNDFLAVY